MNPSWAIIVALVAEIGPPRPLPVCADLPHSRLVPVHDADGLTGALAGARPGDLIQLDGNSYAGRFTAAASGTPDAPIVMCGPRAAVLDGGSLEKGYGLHITGNFWIFQGFSVTRSKKGIMLDGANHNLLSGLEVAQIGQEGIHFRAFSSDNVLRGSLVHHTGREGSPHYGEGVYVGSAKNHWCDASSCGPDRSDRNLIVGNVIGPETTAESVDIKEGTSFGVVRDNVFLGAGMVAGDGGDSFVDVKGNGWLIEGNRGKDSPRDGFQLHEKVEGWARDNLFSGNDVDLAGPGVGIRVDGGGGNVVGCDNQARGERSGQANVPCVKIPGHARLRDRGRGFGGLRPGRSAE